jgi:uncharacterized protein with HEPN domain
MRDDREKLMDIRDAIDTDIVWQVVEKDLPALEEIIKNLL